MAIFAVPLSLFYLTFAFTFSYISYVTIYRLYLHPLSKFPGPKLAALTYWYDFYYDVLKGSYAGQRIFEIEELHARYGKQILLTENARLSAQDQSSASIRTSSPLKIPTGSTRCTTADEGTSGREIIEQMARRALVR